MRTRKRQSVTNNKIINKILRGLQWIRKEFPLKTGNVFDQEINPNSPQRNFLEAFRKKVFL